MGFVYFIIIWIGIMIIGLALFGLSTGVVVRSFTRRKNLILRGFVNRTLRRHYQGKASYYQTFVVLKASLGGEKAARVMKEHTFNI